MAKWWDDLTYDEQIEYIKDHPKTKLKPIKPPASNPEPDTEEPEVKVDKVKDPSKLKQLGSYIKNNKGKIALAAAAIVLGMQKRFDKAVDDMPEKKRASLANAIRGAISIKNIQILRKMSFKVALLTGIMFIGATGLSIATGIDLTLAVPILADAFWGKISDTLDDKEFLKNTGKAYTDSVSENLDDEDIVKKSASSNKADVVVDTEEKNNNEKAFVFSIASNHESDLNKTMLRIERASISSETDKIIKTNSSTKKILNIIDHVGYIENTIPVLTNILVAGISIRGGLASRAKEQLDILSKEIKRCNGELATIANRDSSISKTPVITKLKKLLNHEGSLKSGFTYVRSETGAVQACELHCFDRINVDDTSYNNVSFYSFKNKNNLCIATAINSSFSPKTFEQIKIVDLANWLENHNLRSKSQ